jgi:hypothetical protein
MRPICREKLLNCNLHLLGSIRQPALGFVLSRVVEIIDDNDVEVVEQQDEGQGCTKNAHFIHPPLFCLCSDSPSVMVKLRKEHEFRLDRLLKPSSTVFLSAPIKAGSCWKGLQFCRLNVTRAEKPPSPL